MEIMIYFRPNPFENEFNKLLSFVKDNVSGYSVDVETGIRHPLELPKTNAVKFKLAYGFVYTRPEQSQKLISISA